MPDDQKELIGKLTDTLGLVLSAVRDINPPVPLSQAPEFLRLIQKGWDAYNEGLRAR